MFDEGSRSDDKAHAGKPALAEGYDVQAAQTSSQGDAVQPGAAAGQQRQPPQQMQTHTLSDQQGTGAWPSDWSQKQQTGQDAADAQEPKLSTNSVQQRYQQHAAIAQEQQQQQQQGAQVSNDASNQQTQTGDSTTALQRRARSLLATPLQPNMPDVQHTVSDSAGSLDNQPALAGAGAGNSMHRSQATAASPHAPQQPAQPPQAPLDAVTQPGAPQAPMHQQQANSQVDAAKAGAMTGGNAPLARRGSDGTTSGVQSMQQAGSTPSTTTSSTSRTSSSTSSSTDDVAATVAGQINQAAAAYRMAATTPPTHQATAYMGATSSPAASMATRAAAVQAVVNAVSAAMSVVSAAVHGSSEPSNPGANLYGGAALGSSSSPANTVTSRTRKRNSYPVISTSFPLSNADLLRPETAESLFYLWRATGDSVYREWGWNMFRAWQMWCKVPTGGYAKVNDVTQVNIGITVHYSWMFITSCTKSSTWFRTLSFLLV